MIKTFSIYFRVWSEMRPFKLVPVILAAAAALSGCAAAQGVDVYNVAAEPYSAFTEEDVHSLECRIEFGDEVFVSGAGAWFSGKEIDISEGGIYNISGKYDGCIYVTATEPVKLVFSGADINNCDGCAISSTSERLVIEAVGAANRLSGTGGEYSTSVYSAGTLVFVGSGSMDLSGNIFASGGIVFGGSVNTVCEVMRTAVGDFIYGALAIN